MTSYFVSQFKINGVPILPPAMTPEVIAEVAEYRRRAVKVENRVREFKAAKAASLAIPDSPPQTAVAKSDESPARSNRRNSFTLEAPSPGLPSLPHFGSPVHEPLKAEPAGAECSDESPRPRIIRSNSYTLESPSPLLMQHIQNESLNIKMSSSMSEIRREEPTMTVVGKSHVKRLKFEGGVDQQQPTVPVNSALEIEPQYSTTSWPNSDCQLHVQKIQTEHQQRKAALLKRQQEEQLALQERFRVQQEELMTMLLDSEAVLDEIHTSTPLPTSPNESTVENDEDSPALQSFRKLNISTKQFSHSNQSQSSIDNLSSSQTLLFSSNASRTNSDFEDSNELFKTCNNDTNDINGNIQLEGIRSYAETIKKTLLDRDLCELTQFDRLGEPGDLVRRQAASVINAYARGYLTRRLFQTERVQKVIQVIRDTLLFILDLHHESTGRQQIRSPADLQLKRTLLHQLTSACYQLHEIFFGIPVCKRMEIIRADRENLRRKLENRPWTASSERSIRSGSSSKSQKQNSFRKLQKCSLYSVNIEGTQSLDNNNGPEEDNESLRHQPTQPQVPEFQPRSFRPSPVIAESPLNLSDNLTKAVVTRLVNQVKSAAANQQLRPKTTGATNRTKNNTSWEQRHF
ncbi:centriolar coiled-coil protein of 110 kDa [Culex pipiens pallens]|uniref:centriolar coiled-coil protein of 110 kDa n=1 Tax=Culex pipiens pallens TaxID=42434 RepID=UPI0019530F3C|nr:centriolar coiled-coil protein of 110 kDa [Culex pipiens pallens]